MRHVLVDKQGNFGSIAGLPPAAMRYTEARMSAIAASMLEDLKLDTVDFVPTYDERRLEPAVLPSKFPNLLVNGANGIAVGMATSIPPHNLGEICDALVKVIDEPDVSIDELMEIVPGPDFPTGGMICGRSGIRRGYYTGRGNVVVRARAEIEEHGKNRYRIVVKEIPFQQARDRIEERIAALVNEGRIAGISAIRNESDLKEPVRLILELKRDADPEVVLNQLYQFSRAARHFLDHPLGPGRRQAAGALVQESAGGVHPPPADGDSPPHPVPLEPGAAAEAHRGGPAAGPRQYRRGDPRDPHLGHPARGQAAADGNPVPVGPDAAGAGRRGFRGLRRGARTPRKLHPHPHPGRRHPPHDARPVGQPGAGAAGRRTPQPVGRHQRVSPYPFRRAEHPPDHPRGPDRVEAEARHRAAHRGQRRRAGRHRHGGSDRRGDDGRLHQQQRLHQAHAAERPTAPSIAAARD